jgi:hypothetical protein
MPTISQGSEVILSLGATDAYQVTVKSGGEAYVDLLSGAPGSPYSSPRMNGKTVLSKVFGPYGTAAKIKVRATSGSVTYESYSPEAPITGTAAAQAAFTSLVSGAGIPTGFLAKAHGLQIDFTLPGSLSLVTWTGATGTLTLTREVTLDGRPTLRVDLPAACTRVELGVTAGFSVPAGWDVGVARTMGCPVYVVDRTPFGVMQLYVGDSTYTNFDLLTTDIPTNEQWNGWHVLRYRDTAPGESNPSKTGPVTQANVSQGKIRINKSAGTAGTVYLSWMGTMPIESAKVLWTADDGYDEWYSWLMPTASGYNIPFALGFDRYYVSTSQPNFMTEAQVRLMAADTTGLFEMYPHGTNNIGNTDVGAAAYLANDDATWAWLQSLGVKNARTYHPYVKGQFDETTVAGMKARGVSLCRTVAGAVSPGRTFKPSIANTQQADSNLRMPIGLSLESGVTLATAKAAIDTAISTGSTLIIMSHEFVTSGVTGLQWLQSDTAALMEYAAAKERSGLLQNIKASQLAAQIVQPA